jgi:hypothetical protein
LSPISAAYILLTAMQDEDQQVDDGRNNLLSFTANGSWDTQHSVGLSDEITRVRIPAKVRNHSFPTDVQTSLCSLPVFIQWLYEALFSCLKWPGREAAHSPLTNSYVKSVWRCTSNVPNDLKHVDGYTLQTYRVLPHTFLNLVNKCLWHISQQGAACL